MTEWRKNGTCGACTHFTTDFGEAPAYYGHCKMYQRNGSRASSDATCHEFQPLEGFADKVVLAVRTTVPDSSRKRTAPGRNITHGEESSPVVRRRDGEAIRGYAAPSFEEVLSEGDDTGARDDLIDALASPSGAIDAETLDLALLDILERYGLSAPLPLDREFRGATLVLQPADRGLKAAEIEVDYLFHKVIMVRDRLRLVEQKINANSALSNLEKIELHHFITRGYGAMSALTNIFRKTSQFWTSRRPARLSLERMLRLYDDFRVLELAPKWQKGEVTIVDAEDDPLMRLPLELFFERTCRLRFDLEALAMAIDGQRTLTADDKRGLLDYVSKSQGSLTTLNILFRHAEDKFSSK